MVLALLLKIFKKYTFFFGPFTSDFTDAISIIGKIRSYLVIRNLPAKFTFHKAYMKRTPSEIACVGF